MVSTQWLTVNIVHAHVGLVYVALVLVGSRYTIFTGSSGRLVKLVLSVARVGQRSANTKVMVHRKRCSEKHTRNIERSSSICADVMHPTFFQM